MIFINIKLVLYLQLRLSYEHIAFQSHPDSGGVQMFEIGKCAVSRRVC
jgi:hypothetical protein